MIKDRLVVAHVDNHVSIYVAGEGLGDIITLNGVTGSALVLNEDDNLIPIHLIVNSPVLWKFVFW
jgi:hypothetical protein